MMPVESIDDLLKECERLEAMCSKYMRKCVKQAEVLKRMNHRVRESKKEVQRWADKETAAWNQAQQYKKQRDDLNAAISEHFIGTKGVGKVDAILYKQATYIMTRHDEE